MAAHCQIRFFSPKGDVFAFDVCNNDSYVISGMGWA